MKNKLEKTIKALELNSDKEYLLVCKEKTFDRQEMFNLTKETNIRLVFIVKDINDIELKELDDAESYIKEWREKHAKHTN